MAVCPSVVKFCTVRATRLDPVTGGVVDDDDNYVVTNGAITLQMTPDVEEGTESTLKNGCGDVVASSKTPDRLKRWNLTLTMARFDAALFEILTGNTVVLDGGDPIGIIGRDQFADDFTESLAAFEGWAQAFEGDAPDSEKPYFYVFFAATTFGIGDTTFGEEFAQLPLTGFSRTNTAWSTGPYDDTGLSEEISTWALIQVDEPPPSSVCGYQTVAASS